jgi:deoxyhypusine synthase
MTDERPKGTRSQELSDGHDFDLEPLEALDLSRVESFDDLLRAMRSTSFGGRQLGEAADVLYEMVSDRDCLVVGTFSGAMTVAKQGLVLCDMIDQGMLDVVVSTGALMAHGFVEATGLTHFKVNPELDDREMYYAGFDRVYDTLELEKNLDDVEVIVKQVLSDWPEGEPVSSSALHRELGRWLAANTEGRGILRSAFEQDVPVYVPAFSDSELGLDFALFNRRREAKGEARLLFDPFLDLEDYTARVLETERLGIFTVGGGVPRNWAQQVGPYLDIMKKRGVGEGALRRFRYGVRLCPEPVHWGGLSGCTYSEGVSWGKFLPPSDGGRFAEVPADATLVWPLLVAGVLERMGRR